MKKSFIIALFCVFSILLVPSTSAKDIVGGQDLMVTTDKISEKNDALRYEITVGYPQTEYRPPWEYLSDNEPPKRFNNLLKSLVSLRVNQFQKSAAEFYEDASPDEIMGSYQEIGYSEYRVEPMGKLVSLVVSEDRYFIGTAHPTGVRYFSVTYDIVNQRQVKLYNLFRGGSNYLEKFSEYATDSLKKQLGEDAETLFLPEGVAPKWYNFKNFALKSTGISFFFGSYQVAPYYTGPQEVTIPYSELQEYINPNGPLGYLRLVSFAQCLTSEKVKMYGAYWCPYCTNQKSLFGDEAFSKINYIECDAQGEGGNPELCLSENIKAYPTWEFSDLSRVEGTMELAELSKKTGCTL